MLAHYSHFLADKIKHAAAALAEAEAALEHQPADEQRRATLEAARREHARVQAARESLAEFINSRFVLY